MEEIKKHNYKFPYLVIKLMTAVYCIKELSKYKTTEEGLMWYAFLHMQKIFKPVCLVLGEHNCIFFDPIQGTKHSTEIPAGGFIVEEYSSEEEIGFKE